ncbi:MAG TPA: ThuA domain-containing protein [Polyangiaceae bacterium]|jgi:cytochrome c|nr:ThuA domain-containing protein [Polyangiaceae bacterium]
MNPGPYQHPPAGRVPATLATNVRAAHPLRTQVRVAVPRLFRLLRPVVFGWKALATGAVLGVLATRLLACAPSSASRASAGAANVAPDGSASLQVLVFSATAGYRHASIPDGIAALTTLAGQRGWTLTATEDATQFQDSVLSRLDVIVFLSTTGDVLDTDQQAALVRYVQSGKGWVGIHSASDTEHDWPWYGGLVGAYFQSHPDIQQAAIHVEDPAFPATSGLPDPWVRTDEWYAFTTNPRGRVHVLLSLDEDSYAPGDSGMDGDHPIAWYQVYEGGRSFYTALGHTSESYQEPLFVAQLAEAVEWAGGR